MKLYYVHALWFDSDGAENLHLWVRASSLQEAFDLWVDYYEINDGGGPRDHNAEEDGAYTLELAERHFDGGFAIHEKRTYSEPLPAPGAILWDDVDRLLIGAL